MRDLIRWAKAVADGDPLDPAQTTDPDDPERARVLQQFQIVAEIARLHRSTPTDVAPHASESSAAASSAIPSSLSLSVSLSSALSSSMTEGEDDAPGRARPTSWGHLTLVERIGQGSFGVVYRAWDTRLDRTVALKLLYRESDDAQRPETATIAEGRLLARLRHPNVVSVHGADRLDDCVGIWMELINGRTLEEIVHATGPLGAPEATLIGLDCCRALAAIHQAGLLHRDLKPRNVMRERGGRIVVMDFGAARLRSRGDTNANDLAPSRRAEAKATIKAGTDADAIVGTGSGARTDRDAHADAGAGTSQSFSPRPDFVGTPLYLAPEIFRGEPASVQSDIYSLGVLLYFLVTGTTPVTGANAAEVAANQAANARQPLREARPDLPEAFITAVQRALSPDPASRFSSAAAFAEQLSRVGAVGVIGTAASARDEEVRRKRTIARAVIVSTMVVLATVAGGWMARAMRGVSQPAAETRLLLPMADLRIESVAAAPDGRRLAFAGLDARGVSHLWHRPLDAFDATRLAGTEGAAYPFWSPDGRSIGYFAKGTLWIISAAGGAPRALAQAPNGRGAAWRRDDQIVFAPSTSSPLFRVSAQGGSPVAVTTLDAQTGDTSHRWPVFLPGERRLAFLRICRSSANSGTFVTALDNARPRKLADATSRIAFTPAGVMIYAQDTKLLAQQVDEVSGRVRGEPRTLAENLVSRADTRDGVFSLSPGGALAYGIGDPVVSTFDIYDRRGRPLFARTVPGVVRSFTLSPDGGRLLLERLDPVAGTDDVWTLDLESDRLVRLTMGPENDTDPIWSPDGQEVVFSSDRGTGQYDLYRRPAEPGGADTLFSAAPGSKFAEDWSPDNRSIVIVRGHEGARRLSVLATADPESPRPLIDAKAQDEMDEPAFSPDSRLLAYHSTESGIAEVFVMRADGVGVRWQVSPRGGVQPRWRADGGEIFYLAMDGTLMAAPVQAGAPASSRTKDQQRGGASAFRAGTPRPLLATGLSPSFLLNDYAIAADGSRIIVRRQRGGQVTRLAVVIDWRAPF